MIREEWRIVGSGGVNNLDDFWRVEGIVEEVSEQGALNDCWTFIFV